MVLTNHNFPVYAIQTHLKINCTQHGIFNTPENREFSFHSNTPFYVTGRKKNVTVRFSGLILQPIMARTNHTVISCHGKKHIQTEMKSTVN